MGDFDRNRPNRSENPYRRQRDVRDELPSDEPIRRRPEYGDDVDMAPRRHRERGFRDVGPREVDDASQTPLPTRRERTPREERYADRFRRQRQPNEDEPDVRSYRASRDPYDRLRRVGNRSPRPVDLSVEDEAGFEQYEDEDLNLDLPGRRSVRRPVRQRAPRLDQQRFREMGAVFTHATPEYRPLMMGGLASVVSLVLLAILILVRTDAAGDWIPLHLNAEGTPTGFGSTGTLWRLPFFALLTTITTFGLGWWLRAREAYAVQYLVVGALMVHCLIWVGAINLLW